MAIESYGYILIFNNVYNNCTKIKYNNTMLHLKSEYRVLESAT